MGRASAAPGLIDYARLDTHYLLALRDALEGELRARGRMELALEDFRRGCSVAPNNGGRHLKERWERIEGQQDLSPRAQTILNELCLCREKLAEQLNRPLFKVLDDRRLLELAQAVPDSLDALQAAGLTRRQVERFGRALLEAIERGQTAPLVKPTEIEKPSPAVLVPTPEPIARLAQEKAEAMGVRIRHHPAARLSPAACRAETAHAPGACGGDERFALARGALWRRDSPGAGRETGVISLPFL